ncbi:hypothetical protein EDI_124660, partial [Entamoeba dispar SAW760]
MSQKLSPIDINEIFEIDVTKKEIIEKEKTQKGPKKMNEENLKILQKFDSYDTEHSKELDVFQLKKYIEKEFNISLNEETIKYHCGQTFLEKAYKVQRNEFIAFHKYIISNINEISKEKTNSIFDEFENQFRDKGGADFKCKYLDRNAFVISNNEKPHLLKNSLEKPQEINDTYHSFIFNQLFSDTNSIYKMPNQYRSVFDGKPPLKLSLVQGNEEMFHVDSLIQTENRKPGTRKRKSKYLFEYYNPRLSEIDLLYSSNLTNAKSQSLEADLKVKKPSLIEITGFKTNLSIDNLYCRMSFYDKDYIKLTSNFYFVITAEKLKDHMENNKTLEIPIASAVLKKEYIANLCQVFVVLEVYKQMDSDINLAREIYCDDNKREVKVIKKYNDHYKESIKVFEQKGYLQLLMFSAKLINFQASYSNIKLVKPNGDPKDVGSMIRDIEKMKTCGEWSFKYRGTRPEIVHIDGPYRMFSPEKNETSTLNILMLTDISPPETDEIYIDYQNLLFVYPSEVSLGKEKKKSGIILNVYLRDSDSLFDESKPDALKMIFPCQEGVIENLETCFTSSVSIDKVGHFIDEVKIQLPFPLNEKHHLLFVIKDINVDDGTEGKHFFAKLPLYQKGTIVQGGEHTIQVLKDMVPNYLQQGECYDTAKVYVRANIQLVSSVYPQDPVIAQFISGKATINDIRDIDYHYDLVHFLPCILQRCIDVLNDRKREEIYEMFRVFRIIDLTKENKTDDDDTEDKYLVYKNPLILNAINHFVPTKTSGGHYLCTIILSTLPIIFDKAETIAKERLKYVWIIFALIIKSMVGYYEDKKVFDLTNFHDFCMTENGKMIGGSLYERSVLFSDFLVYCSDNKIVDGLTIRDANLFFGEFIRDLSLLWRHDEMAKLIDSHLDNLSMMKENSISSINNFQQLLRLEFISVLAESDHLYQINGPQLLEIKEINKLNDQLQQRHTLMFIILRQYFQLILSPDKTVSTMALQELIIIMNKYDLDKQFSTQTERDKFFNMIFPFVLFILDDSEKINEWKAKDCLADLYDIESLYVIFFFILKNLKETTIQQWLVSDFLPSLLNSLLTHIRKALLLFSRYPYDFIPNSTAIYSKELIQLIKDIENKDTLSSSRSPSPSLMRSSSTIHSKISALGSSTHRLSSRLKRTLDSYEQEKDVPPTPRKGDHSQTGSDTPKKGTTVYSERLSGLGRLKSSNLNTNKIVNCDNTVDNLVIDIALISMDFLETTIGVLVNAENTQALERAQEIISSVLFEVKPTENYLPSLYEFIRSMITTYRDFIFKRPNNLALNLLKNLLQLSNSDNQIQKNFSNNLIFIFAKTNFIVTGNTVATIVNATSALSELQLNDVHNIEKSIQGLFDLAKKYHDNFDTKLQKCIEISLNEGVRRNKSLQRVQQLYKAVDAGDLDVFITFVYDYINILNRLFDFILNAEPTVINGYIEMKRELVTMLRKNESVNMVKEWINFIREKIETTNETLVSFLIEKKQIIENDYEMCIHKINQLEGHCDLDKRDMEGLEEKCKINKKIGEQLLDWAKKSLSIDSCDLESFNDLQLIRKIEDLEKEQIKRTNEVKNLLDEYTSFDETLTAFKLTSNPLFPVTSQEMTDGVRKVLQLHQSRIKAVNSHLQTRTSYDSEKERYINKIQAFEGIIYKRFTDICTEVYGMPIDANFLKESIDKFKALNHLYNNNVNKLEDKKEKMGGLKPSWEIAYCSWEESINYAISVVEWLAQLVENVKNNEENILQMKKWYDNERVFITTVVSTYLWDGLYVSLAKVTMRESNDYLKILAKVSQYLLDHVEEAEKQYEDAGSLLQELRKRKKLPLGFKFLQVIQEKDFEKIQMIFELYDAKWKEEEKVEKIRKDYAALFEEFFNETDKIIDTEPSKVPAIVIQIVQNLRDKLLIYDEQKIEKLNRYCDLKRSEQTVWGRCSALGIPEKEIKQDKETNVYQIPKSPRTSAYTYTQRNTSSNSNLGAQGLPRATRRGDENRDIIGFFMNGDEKVKVDSFHDFSYGQRDAFDDDLKIVQDDIIKILKNLNNLNALLNDSRDPQFVLERYYQFAMDYVSAPQLHMTWIAKLAQQHRLKEQYIEAGLCEVHLVLFIHHLLPEELVSINVDVLNTTFGKFVPNTSVPPNPQFTAHLTEDMILQHITAACHDFEHGKIPWYGLMVASVVIPYYIKKNKYKELGYIHDFVNRMYAMMVDKNCDGTVKDFVQFYYVRLFGTVFGDYLNAKSFIYASTKERMSYLLKETNDILPPTYKGEKHFLRSLDQITEKVIKSENECNILWTQVQPVYDKGNFIQYSSTFNCDELCLSKEASEIEGISLQNAPILSICKKRTVIRTRFVLPSLLTRQVVESEEVIYLTSIEIIIEEIEKRKKNIDYFLSESKKFFQDVDFGIVSSLQKSVGDFFFGSTDVQVGKSNLFNTIKIIDVLNKFFSDLNQFEFNLYLQLYDIVKECTNCCAEALAIVKENTKIRKSSA